MNAAATHLRAAEWVGYQMAIHPRLRRVSVVWLTTHVVAVWSVIAAPPAVASTIAGALNWTGIADSYGVPAGAHYLSVVSTREAITEAGPDLSVNPNSWVQWLGHAIVTGVSHETVANWLQAQASVYVFMITLALWLLRFAMSSTWLYWLATWFRPLFEVLRTLLVDLYVFPICLALGLGVGAYQMLWHGRRGLGWGIILSTFTIGILGLLLTKDPLSDLYSDDGLLTQGRNIGFTVAQAAMNNGAIAAGGSGAQMDNLTAGLTDATIRAPLQVQNFGITVDGIGNCGSAYSAALLTGQPSAPAHAMDACGATNALHYAQHLDMTNLGLGVLFNILGLVFTFFVSYVAYSYIMVAGAAFLNAIMALFAAAPAMIKGRPQRRAWRRLKEFFKHAFLVFVYVVYIAFTAVIVLKMATPGGYAAQVNMTHPVALMVLIALVSAVATGLFFWLKRELGDHTRQDLTHAVRDIIHAGRSGYDRGQRGIERGRDLYQRGRQRISRDDDENDDPDEPLTGKPVAGRSPGGLGRRTRRRNRGESRPTGAAPASRASRPTTPAARRSAPAIGRTSAASGAGGGATAAEAGAAALAPEVVVGVAVASEANRRIHRHNTKPEGADDWRPSPDATHDIDRDSLNDQQQPPASGRTSSSTSRPKVPHRHNPNDDPEFRGIIIDTDDPADEPPAPGRSH